MFEGCILTTSPSKLIELKHACEVMENHADIYEDVSKATAIPWLCIGGIHYREASQDFTKHLHNGDPLSARTVHVPAGRPEKGNPPFTWTYSAIDALTWQGLWRPQTWDLSGMLEFCERYNGLGYRKHGINSPYLWGCTDKYSTGLFVADGQLDMTRVDPRPGIVAIFKYLLEIKDSNVDLAQLVPPNNLIH